MSNKWILLINFTLASLAIALLLFSGGMYFFRPWSIETDDSTPPQKNLPKNSFQRSDKDYADLEGSFMDLEFSPIGLQLPDLRRYIVYYGRNTRPDADPEKSPLHFGIAREREVPVSIPPNQKLFLVYDKTKPRGGYSFSPENTQTGLWIKAKPKDQEAMIEVGMMNDEGLFISEPQEYAEFSLPQKDYVRSRASTWELGKWKVDGTLLARQRARWWGQDLFIENHGGDEYANVLGKQRIDFGEKDEKYSIYLSVGDSAVWDEDHWRVVEPGPETRNLPLLTVKKIEERLMNLELWTPDGAFKVPINLLKSSQAWITENLEKTFKFVGARTRSQFVFELKGERTQLRPNDWLLYSDNVWRKLTSVQDIDDYVNLKTLGTLFVFEGIINKDGQQILVGTMYNSTRTEMKSIELPIQQGSSTFSTFKPKEDTEDNEDEDDEDLDDEDLE